MPEVAVSLGSNLDRESNICAAVETIKSLYPDAIFSAVFESEAVGFEGPAFYNLAAAFETDLEMGWDISAAASSDALEDTLSYKDVAKRVNAFVVETQANLVETLAEGIAGLLQEEFGVPWCRVRINKRGAVTGARDVGVDIERGQQ